MKTTSPFVLWWSLCASMAFLGSFSVNAQEIDEDLVDTPLDGLRFEECFRDLVFADANGDGVVTKAEYLPFINEFGGNQFCWFQTELTFEQHAAFNNLACLCRQNPAEPPNCCNGKNAQIRTAGAINPGGRTEFELWYLRQVCIVTEHTIGYSCPPEYRDRGTSPGVTILNQDGTAIGSDSGLQDWARWLIIALAILLLLLLCCCCCVIRRRRAKASEEEEQEEIKEADLEMAPDEAAPVKPAMGAVVAIPPGVDGGMVATGDDSSDESYEGDERKRRGTNFPDPEGEQPRRILVGEGPIPDPDHDPERVVLKPFDLSERSDPEWDPVGRNINEYKPPPEDMSEQEFERYIPDSGVHDPQRPDRAPVGPAQVDWDRLTKDEPDEIDDRKYRVQTGLGDGEVWDALDQPEEMQKQSSMKDVFDWVVTATLGVLDNADDQGHFDPSETIDGTEGASEPAVEDLPAAPSNLSTVAEEQVVQALSDDLLAEPALDMAPQEDLTPVRAGPPLKESAEQEEEISGDDSDEELIRKPDP